MAFSYRIGLKKAYQRGLREDLPEEAIQGLASRSAYRRSFCFYFFTAAGLFFIDVNTSTVLFGTSIIFSVLAIPLFLILALIVSTRNQATIARWLRTGQKP